MKTKTEKRLFDAVINSSIGLAVAQGSREVKAAYKLEKSGIVTVTPCGSTYESRDRAGNTRRKFLTMVQIKLVGDK